MPAQSTVFMGYKSFYDDTYYIHFLSLMILLMIQLINLFLLMTKRHSILLAEELFRKNTYTRLALESS